MSNNVSKDKKILDAGCGSGFFSKYFICSEAKTYSLDYSVEALEITKKITNNKTIILNNDLLSSDLREEISDRFDIIFSDGLFEHFKKEDQDKILNNLINVLSTDGIIITFVPNVFSPWQILRPFFMPGIKEKPFTFKELINLNERNNLKVILEGGINVFPFVFSPDKLLGKIFGMLLFTFSKKNE
ncbi:MAG: class I SAM-dependent methyltransferase [Candidatus Zapsychrus exili]|nr:class I SAM-dependent methyltransferase [Candidatus Zapsychrus exili]